ncbi:DUF4113 domain-containing protein [Ochrobactrum quorumnocens]|uniref:DUF4113 domain-containing protein n=1 Tax=Ochrobactrum quorumnocens TaxID=271865 RepID=UPI003BA2E478
MICGAKRWRLKLITGVCISENYDQPGKTGGLKTPLTFVEARAFEENLKPRGPWRSPRYTTRLSELPVISV